MAAPITALLLSSGSLESTPLWLVALHIFGALVAIGCCIAAFRVGR